MTLEAALVERLKSRMGALDAGRLWADSGAMALTGDADGEPLAAAAPVAALVQTAAELITELQPDRAAALTDAPALLGERAALLGLGRRGRVSCGGGTRLLTTADGWLAVALPRPEDVAAVPAWLELIGRRAARGPSGPTGAASSAGADPWAAVSEGVAGCDPAAASAAARLLEIPCAVLNETPRAATPWWICAGPGAAPAAAPLVVDLSALWAGPLCADLLRRAGARVVKVEDPSRPDGSRLGPPPFADVLNGGKRSVALDLSVPAGRRDLVRLLEAADVVVTSSRPRAFERLGVDIDAVLSRSATVWVAVTAHGWSGSGRDRVGFGDDVAVAGGLVAAAPRDGEPRFLADAVADPLTGVLAALAAEEALARGGSWFVDAPLARAAAFAAGLGPVAPSPEPARRPRARRPDGAIRPLGADTTAVWAELEP